MSAATAIVHQLLEDNEDAKAHLMDIKPEFMRWRIVLDDNSSFVYVTRRAGFEDVPDGRFFNVDEPDAEVVIDQALSDGVMSHEDAELCTGVRALGDAYDVAAEAKAGGLARRLLEGDDEGVKADLMAQPDPVIFDHWELYFNELNAEGEYGDDGMSIFFRTYAGAKPFPTGSQVDMSSVLGQHLYRLAVNTPLYTDYADRWQEVAYLLCIDAEDFDGAMRYEDEVKAPRGFTDPRR